MKSQIKRSSKQIISMLLAFVVALTAIGLPSVVPAKAASITNGKVLYMLNSGNWDGCQLYFWGSGWSNSVTFSKISGTDIYANNFTNGYGYDGCKFRSDDNWTNQSDGDITSSFSNHTWFDGSSTTGSTTITNMNGKAKIYSKISTNGTSYSTTANTKCVATVSSVKVTSGATSTTATTASTGSANNVSVDTAYGATVSYSGSATGEYEFLGFSKTDSSSLPSDVNATVSYTNSVYNGNDNDAYYAYFRKKSYNLIFSQPSNGTIKYNDSTTSPVSILHGSSINIVITPNSGYKIKSLKDNTTNVTAAVGSTSAYTYTISSFSTAHTIAATMEAANTQLAAPTNVALALSTVTATQLNSQTFLDIGCKCRLL